MATRSEMRERRKQVAQFVTDNPDMTMGEVCRHTGSSASLVRNACGEHGVVVPASERRARSVFKAVQIIALVAQGKTYEDIMEEVGADKSYISRIVNMSINNGFNPLNVTVYQEE